MKCPRCGSLDVRSHFGITELAFYECENCGRAIPNNYTGEKGEKVPIQKPSKTPCNTKRIIINFRVTVKQWENLLARAGEKGKLSSHIRQKLGLKEK